MRGSRRWVGVLVVGGVVVAGGCGSSANSGGSGGSGGLHGLGGRTGTGGMTSSGVAGAAGVGGVAGGAAGVGGVAGGAAGVAGVGGGPAAGAAGSVGGAVLAGGPDGGAAAAGTGGAAIGTGGAGVGGAGVGGAMAGSSGSSCLVPSTPGAWAEIAPRPADSGLTITDSFALAADDLLFAGTSAPGTGGNQLRVVRWSQGCWSEELSMPIDATATRASVHGVGPNDLWAVGGELILHNTGQGWTPLDEGWRSKIQLTPRMFNAPALPTFVRVRAVATGDVWINEVENVVHWTSGTWSSYNFDSPDYPANDTIALDFTDIWIDGPNDIWVADGSDVVGDTYDPAYVRHFDGANWTAFDVAVFNLFAIWRSGATLWLATGTQPPEGTSSINGTLVPFSGTSPPPPMPVLIQGTAAGTPDLRTIWGRAANDLWSAGSDVAHFDGANWSWETDVPSAARSPTGDGTNTYVGGDPNAVWLVTPGPRFFRKSFGP